MELVANVFISYRRDDSAPQAGRMKDILRRNGHTVFLDLDIPLGVNFPEAIQQALAQSHTMLVLIGEKWLFAQDKNGRRRIDMGDDFVRREIAAGLQAKIPLVPILVSRGTMPQSEQLPESIVKLSEQQGIQLTEEQWDDGIGRLLAFISGITTPRPSGSHSQRRQPLPQLKLILARSKPVVTEPHRRLRKFSREQGLDIVEYHNSLHTAAEDLLENSRRSILITLDFDPSYVIDCLPNETTKCEVVISPPASHPTKDYPSASLIPRSTWRIANDPSPFLRKALIRLAAAALGYTIRKLESDTDLRTYLSLRYSVWESLGYLPAHKITPTRWEVDYTDRTALPLGLFAQDGQMAGCIRLVRGREVPNLVSVFTRLLSQQVDRQLKENFAFPRRFTHPYDLLDAFPKFSSYYKKLFIPQCISHGEVSRVIVDPEHRGQGLGEVLVDSLISMARSERIARLFLACRAEHRDFYQLSGFSAISDLTSDHFGAIAASSIAMDREVTRHQTPST
jgi:predicted GNAT family N-acyltransferase